MDGQNLQLHPLVFYDRAEINDPRGGRVINSDSSQLWDNLHVPYRGVATDFNAPGFDPQGHVMNTLQVLPGNDMVVADASLAMVLAGIKQQTDNLAGLGGTTGQIIYDTLDFGVTT